jgi:hypothetical protein
MCNNLISLNSRDASGVQSFKNNKPDMVLRFQEVMKKLSVALLQRNCPLSAFGKTQVWFTTRLNAPRPSSLDLVMQQVAALRTTGIRLLHFPFRQQKCHEYTAHMVKVFAAVEADHCQAVAQLLQADSRTINAYHTTVRSLFDVFPLLCFCFLHPV